MIYLLLRIAVTIGWILLFKIDPALRSNLPARVYIVMRWVLAIPLGFAAYLSVGYVLIDLGSAWPILAFPALAGMATGISPNPRWIVGVVSLIWVLGMTIEGVHTAWHLGITWGWIGCIIGALLSISVVLNVIKFHKPTAPTTRAAMTP